MITNIIFSITLFPQLYHGFRDKVGPIKYSASIPTFIGLYITSYTFWTLDLYLSTILTFITGTVRLLLCIQRLIYEK